MVVNVRQLPDGRVLVNDFDSRRVVLLDSMMNVAEVVLDSAVLAPQPYGEQRGVLLPYRADSSLFFGKGGIMLVIDPKGKVVRTRSYYRWLDVQRWGTDQLAYGIPAADVQGRLVYSVQPLMNWNALPRSGQSYTSYNPDSMLIVAMHLDTWVLDTIAKVRAEEGFVQVHKRRNGSFTYTPVYVPITRADQFAVLSDGTIALVRSLDYRIEYISPDGTRTSTAKIPYAWEPLNDADKKKLVDSLRTATDLIASQWYTTGMIKWINQYGKRRLPEGFRAPAGYVPEMGFGRDWVYPPGVTFPKNYVYECSKGEEPEMKDERPTCIPGPSINRHDPQPPPTYQVFAIVAPEELPNYRPPFDVGSVRADADGNLWIQTNASKSIPGGPVFDIINRQGELVDRIQIPAGYAIIGFGAGNVVYLTMRDKGVIRLARVCLTRVVDQRKQQ